MDLDAVLNNKDYYKNGYPDAWGIGFVDGKTGGRNNPPYSIRGMEPAYEDGYQRGLASRTQTPPGEAQTPTNKENSMPDTPTTGGTVDLDALAAGLDADIAAEAKGEAPAPTQSAGGFDLLEGIEDGLDAGSGTAWIPEEPGQTLIGYVRYVGEIQSEFKDQKTGNFEMLPMLDIEDRDGNLWSVRAYGAVLPRHFERTNPQVGDAIAIRFLGKEQPKNQSHQPYNNFAVKVVKPKA